MRVNNLGRLPLWGKPTDMLDIGNRENSLCSILLFLLRGGSNENNKQIGIRGVVMIACTISMVNTLT